MDHKTLAQWRDEVLVVIFSEPGTKGAASWRCPVCQLQFEGVPVGQDQEAAIVEARGAFVDHVAAEHGDLVETSVLTP